MRASVQPTWRWRGVTRGIGRLGWGGFLNLFIVKASLANRFHPGTQHMHSSEGYVGTEEALCYATEHCYAAVLHTRRGEAEYNTEKEPDILIFTTR